MDGVAGRKGRRGKGKREGGGREGEREGHRTADLERGGVSLLPGNALGFGWTQGKPGKG